MKLRHVQDIAKLAPFRHTRPRGRRSRLRDAERLGLPVQPLQQADAKARRLRRERIGRRYSGKRVERRLRIVVIGKQARSEEHRSELQSLMSNSYAVFCLTQIYKNTDQYMISDT